jgi:glycosidase
MTNRRRTVIYQLVVRLFGNVNEARRPAGTLEENGVGKFADIDERALAAIRALGATTVWLTGVLRQATLTPYPECGLVADDPDVVKGRAGSFFAVRDYFDVCPDYAVDPGRRMQELEALVARIHAAGLEVMIDLVPNHVARGYGSVVHPELDFGIGDDKTRFFDPQNDFFYLVDPPGRPLVLSRPGHWQPEGVDFDGRFGPEDGGPGRTARVTGNNVTSAEPSETDWYDVVKLNWGTCFVDPSLSRYEPIPSVWTKFDRVVAYWQERGIDGFRVDFAHWVPDEAWRWLLSRAKARRPRTFFLAEAYERIDALLDAGFDAVYLDEALDLLKSLYQGRARLEAVDDLLRSVTDARRGRYALYLENHDERRCASPIVPDAGPNDSGFGSARAGKQLAPLLYLATQGPLIVFNGQEVGEPGAGEEGFGRSDGRTTMFDYWSMPELARWVNGGAFDGGRLSDEQRALMRFYRDLLALCQAPEVASGGYHGLSYANRPGEHAGAHPQLLSYARMSRGAILVVVANFAPGQPVAAAVRVPLAVAEAAGLGADVEVAVRLVLDDRGRDDRLVAHVSLRELALGGFVAEVPNQAACVYTIRPSVPRAS